MEMDGPVDGCPMETYGPVDGCPMEMDGPAEGGQWRWMGRWMVVQWRQMGRQRVGNAYGWASGWLSNGDRWAGRWCTLETDGPVDGCPMSLSIVHHPELQLATLRSQEWADHANWLTNDGIMGCRMHWYTSQ